MENVQDKLALISSSASGSPMDLGNNMKSFLNSCIDMYTNILSAIGEVLSSENEMSIEEIMATYDLNENAIYNVNGKVIYIKEILQTLSNIDSTENIESMNIDIPAVIVNSDGTTTSASIAYSELVDSISSFIEVQEVLVCTIDNLSNYNSEGTTLQALYSQISNDVQAKLGYYSASAQAALFQLKDIIYSSQDTLSMKLSKIFSMIFNKQLTEIDDKTSSSSAASIFSLITTSEADELEDAGITGKHPFLVVLENGVNKVGKVFDTVVNGFLSGVKYIAGAMSSFTKWGKEAMEDVTEWVDDNIINTHDVSVNSSYNDYSFDSFVYQYADTFNANIWTNDILKLINNNQFFVYPGLFTKFFITKQLPDSVGNTKLNFFRKDLMNMSNDKLSSIKNRISDCISNNKRTDVAVKIIQDALGLCAEYNDYSKTDDMVIYNRVLDGRYCQRFYDYLLLSLFCSSQLNGNGLWWSDSQIGLEWNNCYDAPVHEASGVIRVEKNGFTKQFINYFVNGVVDARATKDPTNLELAKMLTGKGGVTGASVLPSQIPFISADVNKDAHTMLKTLSLYMSQLMENDASLSSTDAFNMLITTIKGEASDIEFITKLHDIILLSNFSYNRDSYNKNLSYIPYYYSSSLSKGKYHINTDQESTATISSLLKVITGVMIAVATVATGFKLKSTLNNQAIKFNARINALNWSISSNIRQGKDVTASVNELRKLTRKAYLLSLIRGVPQSTISATSNVLTSVAGSSLTGLEKIASSVSGDKYSNENIYHLIKS